jgi:solute carrier family 25 protein 16
MLRKVAVDYHYEPNPTGRRPLKVWAQLCAGALSGLCAQTASYPLEVIRRRMQVGGAIGKHLRIVPTLMSVVRERGIRGLFVGLTIGYMKVMPMFACSFFVYERAKLLVGI